MSNNNHDIYYLDTEGLAYYDARIKDYIEQNIPEAATAIMNAVQESGESEIIKIAVCTQATYDALAPDWEEGTLYIISDDNTLNELKNLINSVSIQIGLESGELYDQDTNNIITIPEYPTRESLDIDQVVNTGDSAIPEENGDEKFTTGGAYVLKQAVDSKVSNVLYDTTNKKITKTINNTTYDVVSTANLKTDMNLDDAEHTANRVSNWQGTPDDTHYPTEKLVKDSLDGKVNNITYENGVESSDGKAFVKTVNNTKTNIVTLDTLVNDAGLDDAEHTTNKVPSWSSTTTDTNYPTEKLVKDSLDTKFDKSNIGYVEIDTSDLPNLILTTAQYNEVLKHYCIMYDTETNRTYYKTHEDASDIWFSSDKLNSSTSGNNISVGFESLTVSKTDRSVIGDSEYTTLSSYSTTAVNNKLNEDVEIKPTGTDNVFTYNGDTVQATFRFKNLSSATTSSKVETLGLANNTTAGLMSYTDYLALQDVITRVGNLETQTTRLLFPTGVVVNQANVQNFVNNYIISKHESGYIPTPSDYQGIAVVIPDTYHIWHYYSNNSIGWKDDGADTVNQFTNSLQGTIQGSPDTVTSNVHVNDGKVYAESDGTGSVLGWNRLTGRVSTLEGKFSGGVGTETWVFLVKDTTTGVERELNKLFI